MVNIKSQLRLRQKKERQTPDSHKKYGFIERHKDYKLRAENYHQNREKQKQLIRAAENRNPDEYAFEMEQYQKGGILGIQKIKDPYDHPNDVIPQVRLLAKRKELEKRIDDQKMYLYDVHMNKNLEAAQQIDELQKELEEVVGELERREKVKFLRDARPKVTIYDKQLEANVTLYKGQRRG